MRSTTTRLLAAAAVLWATLTGCTPAQEPQGRDAPTPGDQQVGVGDGERPWDVCDYAQHADAHTTGETQWERNVARACDQLREGEEPDRPDLVECYSRADEPGGILAGDIATESCDLLADSEDGIDVAEVDDLARSR